jgi:hypothetical protein
VLIARGGAVRDGYLANGRIVVLMVPNVVGHSRGCRGIPASRGKLSDVKDIVGGRILCGGRRRGRSKESWGMVREEREGGREEGLDGPQKRVRSGGAGAT